MPTSAAGNRPLATRPAPPPPADTRPARGFTLIELMVVVTLIAIASSAVVFAMRDSAAQRLEREAVRLAALLDAARAQSRSSGQVVRWQAAESGFEFQGLPAGALPTRWLAGDVEVQGRPQLVLGPEAVVPPQAVVLTLRGDAGRSVPPLRVATDGVRPFQVQGAGAPQ